MKYRELFMMKISAARFAQPVPLVRTEWRRMKTILTIALLLIGLMGEELNAIAQAPSITSQPTSQTVVPGATATFNVGVTGANPLSYRWYFNGNSISNIIVTVAGSDYVGDDGGVTNASFSFPLGMTLDDTGNFFVADTIHQRIRKITTNGFITTVAGNGTAGFSGDGSAATNASLHYPCGMCVDAAGNLYIADTANQRIREVSAGGIISTVAGTGIAGYSGDDGMATNAELYDPIAVTADGEGNLFIADMGNNRIRKIGTNGIITTVAGNGTNDYSGDGGAATNAALYYPSDIALDNMGSLLIADMGNQRIRRVDSNGIITTVAGDGTEGFSGDGGAATNAELYLPTGIAIDKFGNMFIADCWNNRIREVSTSDVISTMAGNGTNGYSGDGGSATNAELSYPTCVAVDDAGNVYVTDKYHNVIRQVSTDGIITTIAGGFPPPAGDGGLATNASIPDPACVALDSNGDLYIPETSACIVRKVDTNGIITTIAGNGNAGYSGDGSFATNATLAGPTAVATDLAGDLFIASAGNEVIRKVSTSGIITTVAGNGTAGYSGDGGSATNASLNIPIGLAVGKSGDLFIADYWNNRIRKVDTNGIISTVAGNGTNGFAGDGGSATNAELNYPSGVTIDADGNLFIADQFNARVREVTTNGIITTVAGNGTNGYSGDGGMATNAELYAPSDVAVDSAGNLFIADYGNNRVRRVGVDGTITTIAGDNDWGYLGDGDPATWTPLYHPTTVAVDASDNIFIADFANNRIRELPVNQSSNLTISAVNNGITGNYYVVVTNNYGSVTSQVASLSITQQSQQGQNTLYALSLLVGEPALYANASPTIQRCWARSQAFYFSIPTVPDQWYQVQYSQDLSTATWSNLGSPVLASNVTLSISEPITTNRNRFYRVLLLRNQY